MEIDHTILKFKIKFPNYYNYNTNLAKTIRKSLKYLHYLIPKTHYKTAVLNMDEYHIYMLYEINQTQNLILFM